MSRKCFPLLVLVRKQAGPCFSQSALHREWDGNRQQMYNKKRERKRERGRQGERKRGRMRDRMRGRDERRANE